MTKINFKYKPKIYILFLLVGAQLLVIIVLGIKIFHLYIQKKVLGSRSINIIKKEDVIFTSDYLKYFYEPKPNTIEKVNEWIPYKGISTINSDALNERFDYSFEKSKDVYRIITLGDSFTYGLHVDTKDNWPERLEDILNERLKCDKFSKFEVINLGVHGYDFEYAVERYRKRGVKYNPDLVLWYIVDFMRIDERILPLMDYYKKELEKNNELENYIKENHYYKVWELARKQSIEDLGKEDVKDYQRERMLELDDIYKGPLVMVMSPAVNITDRKNLINIFRTMFSSRKDTYIFSETTDYYLLKDTTFLNDGHPNEKGHRIIAEDIFKYLRTNRLIPCN